MNTLNDDLSNETMLAIARGLKPMGARRFRPWLSGSRSSAPATSGSSPAPASPTSATTWSSVTSSPEKVDALRAGRVPFHEPGLDEVLERGGDRLRFTLDAHEAVEGARFVFVCVGTPATYSGDADLSAVWTVLDELQGLDDGCGRRHEEHGAGRDGREGARGARRPRARSGSATSRTRSSSPRAAPCGTSSSPTAS